MHVLLRGLIVAALAAAVSCTRSGDRKARVAARGASGTPAPAASAAASGDEWSVAEVAKRLTEAGLVVLDSQQVVHNDHLHAAGRLLRLGDGTVEIYVYSTGGARRLDAATFDTTHHGLPTINDPHYIESGNLIAVLRTTSDRVVERVSDALTARHIDAP